MTHTACSHNPVLARRAVNGATPIGATTGEHAISANGTARLHLPTIITAYQRNGTYETE